MLGYQADYNLLEKKKNTEKQALYHCLHQPRRIERP
jgi:hypothetical protein